MTVVGTSPIGSEESFPTEGANVIQMLVVGFDPIPSEEFFAVPSGVYQDPLTTPASQFMSY